MAEDLSVRLFAIQASTHDRTKKALLELHDGKRIETVLMGRKNVRASRDNEYRYTICVSSQVGCAMRCEFCATGRLGFRRNLTAEEIIDQYRFWEQELKKEGSGTIDNIVLMGQGEPLLNYEAVKKFLRTMVDVYKLGYSKITISTVGVVPFMNKLVDDPEFPPIRFALSLHSAVTETRARLVPSHAPNFFSFLVDWAARYHARFQSRIHFIGLEYIMLRDVNDNEQHLTALIDLASQMGHVRLNLIPFNVIDTERGLAGSTLETIRHWHTTLRATGFTVTVRYSQGQDIDAACGQLHNNIIEQEKKI